MQMIPPESAAYTGDGKSKSKHRRVSVDGPEQVADDLSGAAMDAASGLFSVKVAGAISKHIGSEVDRNRISAWRALIARFENCDELRHAAPTALGDKLPDIRRFALRVLISAGRPDGYLDKVLEDQDALVRADAVAHLDDDRLLDFIGDSSARVRKTAVLSIWRIDNPALTAKALVQLFSVERADTLAWAVHDNKDVLAEAARRLEDGAVSRSNFVILEALASSYAELDIG